MTLIWYWKKVQWDEQEGDVSWAEVAIDFQAATHTGLTRKEEDWEDETLAWRARIMASATRRVEALCKERVNPGGSKHTCAMAEAHVLSDLEARCAFIQAQISAGHEPTAEFMDQQCKAVLAKFAKELGADKGVLFGEFQKMVAQWDSIEWDK